MLVENIQVQLVWPPVSGRHAGAASCKPLFIIQPNTTPFCMFFEELFSI
jgi:hypothetical protein